jgi:Ca2+-binding RTX toxin-like protein
VGVDDDYTTDFQTALNVPVLDGVLSNDTDVESPTLTAVLVDDVSNGTLSLASDGSFTYAPNAGFSGTDTFTYRAEDSLGAQSAETLVEIAVEAPTTPTNGDDTLTGTPGPDDIDLLAGNDVYDGLAGDDTVNGGSGNDTIDGGADDDRIEGRNGNDSLTGGTGNDSFVYVDQNEGQDTIADFTQGEDVIDVRLAAIKELSELSPTVLGPDTILTYGATQITLEGFTGALTDADFVFVGSGTPEDDVLFGDKNPNDFDGLAGNDLIFGKRADDTLVGGEGDDSLYGGEAEDQLFGGDGNDLLQGGRDNDLLDGGSGNDVLIGLSGDDILTGGLGTDVFVFNREGDTDTITDFTQGEDIIRLKPLGITDVSEVTQTDNGANLDLTFGTNTIVLEGLAGATLVDDDFSFA